MFSLLIKVSVIIQLLLLFSAQDTLFYIIWISIGFYSSYSVFSRCVRKQKRFHLTCVRSNIISWGGLWQRSNWFSWGHIRNSEKSWLFTWRQTDSTRYGGLICGCMKWMNECPCFNIINCVGVKIWGYDSFCWVLNGKGSFFKYEQKYYNRVTVACAWS